MQGLPPDRQSGVAVAVPRFHAQFGKGRVLLDRMRLGQGHPLVEARVGEIAFPVLAGLQGSVSGPGQQARKGVHPAHQIAGSMPVLQGMGQIEIGAVEVDAALMGVEPGQQGGQGGAAKAVGDVAVDKSGRAAGQVVDVGCPHQRIAHEAEVAVALIVGNDEQDVGRGGPEMAGHSQAERRQQKHGQSPPASLA